MFFQSEVSGLQRKRFFCDSVALIGEFNLSWILRVELKPKTGIKGSLWLFDSSFSLLSLFVARINKGAHRYFALSGWKVNTGG